MSRPEIPSSTIETREQESSWTKKIETLLGVLARNGFLQTEGRKREPAAEESQTIEEWLDMFSDYEGNEKIYGILSEITEISQGKPVPYSQGSWRDLTERFVKLADSIGDHLYKSKKEKSLKRDDFDEPAAQRVRTLIEQIPFYVYDEGERYPAQDFTRGKIVGKHTKEWGEER